MLESYITNSSEESELLGISLAKKLKAGDILLLFGDLGAGKTTFTRGLAQGLQVIDDVSSPTFTLFQRYAASDGGLALQHFDCYRLENEFDWYAEGFDELLYRQDAVSVIEWPENVIDALPDEHIKVTITRLKQDNKREIKIQFPLTDERFKRG